MALASMGIYVFQTKFLIEQLRRDAADPNSSRDFGKDIIPYLVENGKAVAHRFSKSCVRSGNEKPGLLARCRNRRCLLGGQYRPDRCGARSWTSMIAMADLDLCRVGRRPNSCMTRTAGAAWRYRRSSRRLHRFGRLDEAQPVFTGARINSYSRWTRRWCCPMHGRPQRQAEACVMDAASTSLRAWSSARIPSLMRNASGAARTASPDHPADDQQAAVVGGTFDLKITPSPARFARHFSPEGRGTQVG